MSAAKVVDQARQLAADLLEASADDVVLDKVGASLPRPGHTGQDGELGRGRRQRGRRGLLGHDRRRASGVVVPVRRPPRGRRARHRDRRHRGDARESPATTAARSSTRTWSRASVTAASRRASRRRLLEEVRYDDDGNPLTGNFADYAIISAAELPSYELIPLETRRRTTRSARKASASRARSVRRPRCRARCATRCRRSACATSTSRSRPRRCGPRSRATVRPRGGSRPPEGLFSARPAVGDGPPARPATYGRIRAGIDEDQRGDGVPRCRAANTARAFHPRERRPHGYEHRL